MTGRAAASPSGGSGSWWHRTRPGRRDGAGTPGHTGTVIRRRVVVHGQVQGVGFRWACARQARSLGVNGSVRNRPDGTVELVAEGEPDAVQALVTWARTGPRHASVTRVEVTEEDPQGLPDFGIDH